MASKFIPEKGVTLNFPGMTEEQMNQILNSGQYDDYVKNLPPAAATAPAPTTTDGATSAFPIAVPPGSTGGPTGNASQYEIPQQAAPGFWREANIAGRNVLAGGMDVAAIPGDVAQIAHRLTGGIVPEGPSWLPTSAGVDRFATDIGVLDPRYTPSGPWENALAIGARGLGGAAVMGGGPAALGRGLEFAGARLAGTTAGGAMSTVGGAMPAIPTLAQGGRIALSGIGGAEAADQTRQAMIAGGYDPSRDPLGIGSLVPALAGTVAGAGVGGLSEPVMGGTPYQRAMDALGTTKAEINSGQPLLGDTGDALRTAIRATPPGLRGITRFQSNNLIGPKGNFQGTSVAANAMAPEIAPQLVANFPDEMNRITAATIANGRWPTLHDVTKKAVIPDAQQRNAIEAWHSGQPIIPEHGVPLFVGMEALGNIANLGSAHFLHTDPMLGALLATAGGTAPLLPAAARMGSRFVRTSPGTVSGAGFGAGVSVPTTTSMGYAGPSTFAPPDQGGPVGQRTDQINQFQ